MAQFTNGFDAYQTFYYSGATSLLAVIQVYASGVFNGRIGFYPDAGPVVPNGVIAPTGTNVPAINYPLSSFNAVMSMIRFEKPLYIFFDSGTGVGFVGTSQLEPVGEQEGK
ncbi:MAG TPA: hypothetical protein VFD70_11025 [Anaerolineae bacterium]|nr:hypothetical protein [Anaerolineae bacterium]